MNKILEIDMENMVAVVQPGVINMDLQRAVEAKGLFYPPDPASQEYSTLGGNVSENAGGMRAAKYGITKDYVMALRAVIPNGEIIRAGKRTIKDVAGYNIAGILIASEGTLGVITEITLKLIAKPKMSQTAMGVFPTVNDAMNAVYKSMAAGVTPVAMEFLDNYSIRAVEQKYSKGLPIEAGAILITDVDGNSQEDLTTQLDIIEKAFAENGCSEFKRAQNKDESNALWFARRNVSQCITVYGSKKLNEDITVPRSKLPDLLAEIGKIAQKYNVTVPCFGHTGDGNVHTNVMVDGSDENHRLKRQQFQPENVVKGAAEDTRFAHNDEIYFSIASILKYVPYCGTIYIITDHQQPSFVGEFEAQGLCRSGQIQVVDHQEIFRNYQQYLPTFNSLTIETMLWNIPNLSQYFIYLNDDFFFNAPSKISDFLVDDYIKIYGHWSNNLLVKTKFNIRKGLNKYFAKPLAPKYTVAQMLSAELCGMSRYFEIHHRPHVLDKILFHILLYLLLFVLISIYSILVKKELSKFHF